MSLKYNRFLLLADLYALFKVIIEGVDIVHSLFEYSNPLLHDWNSLLM